MNKPAVVVHTVETKDDPAWKLLVEARDDLSSNVPFFCERQLNEMDFRTFLVATIERTVTGIVALRKESSRLENALGVGYISTHRDFRNMGVATAMVHALFAHAKLQGKAIANTRYELDGQIYLRPVMERVWNKYPTVELNERDYDGPM